MLFNSAPFLLFFLAVVLLHYLLPGPARRWLLLAASYFFYMCWNPKFIVLLLTLTVIDYAAAIWISKSSGRQRTAALWFSVGANLLFLSFFKYFNFFAANIAQLTGKVPGAWAFDIVLPLGISFHTFQSISYVVDVYRGQQQPIRSFIDYALFIAFFPQLVAGPIVRAKEFFADFYHWKPPSAALLQSGILMLLLGMMKKMIAADQFALIANLYFADVTGHPGMLPAWGGVIAFALQIFFDFSGYTDIAIGSAAILGFHFPKNFRRPYLAFSITEFWRRWHMSLSRWLRDYLYIPLGGNRGGTFSTYRNLMLTMLLGGLWHGASWNFVIWGGYHGALLGAERMAGVDASRVRSLLFRIMYTVLTFTLVAIGWVFFRAVTFQDARYVLGQMFSGGAPGKFLLSTQLIRLALLTLILAIAEERWHWFERLSRASLTRFTLVVALTLLALELFSVTDVAIPFVYFQF